MTNTIKINPAIYFECHSCGMGNWMIVEISDVIKCGDGLMFVDLPEEVECEVCEAKFKFVE